MKHAFRLLTLLSFSIICFSQIQASPTYRSKDTKEIVEKMIAAHGGMAKWNSTQTLSLSHILVFGDALATEFWLSHDTTEIKSERTYQDWSVFNGRLTYDGTKVWTQNWKLENFPTISVNAAYNIVALPWLTQRDDAILEELPKAKLGNDSVLYDVIKMTYKPNSQKSKHKYFKLYIHPETHLLTGIDFNIVHGAFLDLLKIPTDVKSIGPISLIIYSRRTVDGLVFTDKWDAFSEKGEDYGRHIAYNFSLNTKFDEARMKMPADAVIDTSKTER